MRVMCKPGSVGDLGGQPPRSTRPKRFCKAGSDPRALGVIRGVEQPHTETVRMEIYSTRHAELAKTCVAAFSGSFCCVGKRNRPTTTLFVKRTTKGEGVGSRPHDGTRPPSVRSSHLRLDPDARRPNRRTLKGRVSSGLFGASFCWHAAETKQAQEVLANCGT